MKFCGVVGRVTNGERNSAELGSRGGGDWLRLGDVDGEKGSVQWKISVETGSALLFEY